MTAGNGDSKSTRNGFDDDVGQVSSRVFFYGLYMDCGLLESMDLHPREVGAARLDGYRIRIGERATLVPAQGHAAYGMLLDLRDDEVVALYSRPEVRGYVPISVEVSLLASDSVHSARCYILEDERADTVANRQYAKKLAALVARLGLPSEYVSELEATQ